MTRDVLGLFRGARAFRRHLATEAVEPVADTATFRAALALVVDAQMACPPRDCIVGSRRLASFIHGVQFASRKRSCVGCCGNGKLKIGRGYDPQASDTDSGGL